MDKPANKQQEPGALGRRRYATGESSRERILEIARQVLIRDGYHAFTTRRVAEESGISVGNLTYYFPNKASLIEAVMASVFERYADRYRTLLADRSKGITDTAAELISWFMRDAITDDTASLFLELWVLAKHHRFGSEALVRYYDDGIQQVAAVLAQSYPQHGHRELARIAYLMLVLSEGSTAVFARQGKRTVEHEDIIPLAVKVITGLLERSESDICNSGGK